MLLDPTWWQDVAARAGRQAVQVLIPVLALAAAGDITGIDAPAAAAAVALAVVVTFVKAIAGISIGARAPWWQQGIERAAAAAAGAVGALLPADGLGLLALDWGDIGIAAAGAAGLALAAMITNRPQPHPGEQLPPIPRAA
jgi:hypothetical protein